MAQKLPSLSALRAFEAAARHMSFRKAADDLNVTHSAISHQVKTLEEQLGVVLFVRTARNVELTEEGEFLFPILKDSFGRISDGVKFLISTGDPDSLSVQVYITFAMRWLMPRLPDFQEKVPNLQTRLITSYLDWEFDRQNVDVAILMAKKRQADLHYVELFPAYLAPVCSPKLLTGEFAIKEPKDLMHHPIFKIFTSPDDWPTWSQAVGMEDFKPEKGTAFDSYVIALEAAEAGQGVAMLNGPFAELALKEGRLVKPFDADVAHPGKWCLVYRKEHRTDKRIKKFQEWLLSQIENGYK